MIKICKGNTRIAVVLFSWLVIKFPSPRFDRFKSSDCWRRRESLFSFLGELLVNFYDAFIWGVASNTSEALVYRYALKPKYLSPVFTVGLLNFMFYEGEDRPTEEEILVLYQSLSDEARKVLLETDWHERSSHNWRKTPKGLRLIDYGVDPLRTDWSLFLRGFRRELTKATAKK